MHIFMIGSDKGETWAINAQKILAVRSSGEDSSIIILSDGGVTVKIPIVKLIEIWEDALKGGDSDA